MAIKSREEEKFKALLKTRRLKYTVDRKAIYREVMRLSGHFNADSLYERFKNQGSRIGRDTVYRTLPLLLESGVIQKSAGLSKREFFERTSAKGHHDHLVCVRCGKIIEFKCPEIETFQAKVFSEYLFQPICHDHRLFGICRSCR
ncbi:MAG TPA: transcriptional repressor [Candidatus Omnitrophota bacterium]|nr:transcriptional repressor [Candidatus Omnitrophota bacterium]